MRTYRALPCLLFAAGAAGPFVAGASPAPVAWTTCPAELTGAWPTLGPRLGCTRLAVPVDHLDPSLGTIDLGVVRVRASRAVVRKGAIFFNFGGPGGSPLETLPATAADWLATDGDDDVVGRRRQLAEHFDLIAVVPRGLRGGWTFECTNGQAATYDFIPSATDDANLRKVEQEAEADARACSELPFQAYVNSEQNARDMDYVRRAIGEEKLNFFGLSYGTRLGAWYAALFPAHVGRMVFDSTMDVTRTYADAIAFTLEAEDEALTRRVLRPVANAHDRYAMGHDIDALRLRIRAMEPLTRRALAPLMSTPASYVAAMRLDAWLKTGVATSKALQRRIDRTVFSPHGPTQQAIRTAATAALPHLFPDTEPPVYHLGTDGDSVYRATICNDEPWETDLARWRDLARTDTRRFPTSTGTEVYAGMLCAQWGTRRARPADLARLLDMPGFLIVQAEFDHATPLRGAENMRDTFTNARLVVVTGLERHGVFGFVRAPCVEAAVAGYLLDGTLPEQRTTRCLEEPGTEAAAPAADEVHEHTEFWRRHTTWTLADRR